jgi:hypothetical protein
MITKRQYSKKKRDLTIMFYDETKRMKKVINELNLKVSKNVEQSLNIHLKQTNKFILNLKIEKHDKEQIKKSKSLFKSLILKIANIKLGSNTRNIPSRKRIKRQTQTGCLKSYFFLNIK